MFRHAIPGSFYPTPGSAGGGVELPRRELHERCALASGLTGSAGNTWSAVHMSPAARALLPHNQHGPRDSRTNLARAR